MAPECSAQLEERSRKNLAAIISGIQRMTGERVADLLKCDPSTVSRWKDNGEALRIGRVLAACGLKAVPVEYECHDPAYVESLQRLAHRHLERELVGDESDSRDTLQWE